MVSRIADTFYAYDPKREASLQKFCLQSFAAGQKSLLNLTVSDYTTTLKSGNLARARTLVVRLLLSLFSLVCLLCPLSSQLAKTATEDAMKGGLASGDRVNNLVFLLRYGLRKHRPVTLKHFLDTILPFLLYLHGFSTNNCYFYFFCGTRKTLTSGSSRGFTNTEPTTDFQLFNLSTNTKTLTVANTYSRE